MNVIRINEKLMEKQTRKFPALQIFNAIQCFIARSNKILG
jgi:hypothetical protein